MSDQPVQTPPVAERRHPVGRIVLAVVGGFAVLIGLVLLVGGTLLVWAYGTQRDDDGFFTSGDHRIETVTHAVVSEEIDLGVEPDRDDGVVDLGDLATVRIAFDPVGEQQVFVGIGPQDDVAAFLDGVAHAEIDDVDLDPFRVDYRFVGGDAPAGPPGDEGFWVASAVASGPETLEWDLESGRYAVVLMNADGSEGVAVETAVGVKVDWILPVGIGLLVGAAVLLIAGVAMLVFGAHGVAAATPVAPGPVPAPTQSPVSLEGRPDEPLSRWLWLVKWLLLIPHFLILAVLWVAVLVATVAAGVAILVTGRYPRPIFGFTSGVLRWSWRVGFYSVGGFATDRYPPFTLGPAPDYPATLDIREPGPLSRGLVLVKWWLLAIPHYIVLAIVGGGLTAGADERGGGMGLLTFLAIVAAVVLLFTGRYPRGLFDLLVGLNRWIYRVLAYVLLMTDEYPPFRLDQGPTEPRPTGPVPTDSTQQGPPPAPPAT